jgi:rod shape-determining protein MreB
VIDEPSVLAWDARRHEVLAIGEEAWEMIGRTPGYVLAVRPLEKGSISDFETTQSMLRLVLAKAGMGRFNRPRVLACVSSTMSEVERRAVKEAARRAGASEVYLMDQVIAAAIGVDLPVSEPVGSMVVDFGGGTSEAAVMSMGAVVGKETAKIGGYDLDLAVQALLRRQYQLAVGDRTAEDVKLAVASLSDSSSDLMAEVRGRDLMTGLPKTVVVSGQEVCEAIAEQVDSMISTVVRCVAKSPPELVQDLSNSAVNLVGGASQLPGLADRLADDVGLPVVVSRRPAECVVIGAGRCLDDLDRLKPMFEDNRW